VLIAVPGNAGKLAESKSCATGPVSIAVSLFSSGEVLTPATAYATAPAKRLFFIFFIIP